MTDIKKECEHCGRALNSSDAYCKCGEPFPTPKDTTEKNYLEVKMCEKCGNRDVTGHKCLDMRGMDTTEKWEDEFDRLIPEPGHVRAGWISVQTKEVGTHVVLPKERKDEIKSFISRTLLEAQREIVEKVVREIQSLKKYSGKHNAAHTWITNGYCHACQKQLTNQQLEDEFGWNAAIDEVTSIARHSLDVTKDKQV